MDQHNYYKNLFYFEMGDETNGDEFINNINNENKNENSKL